MSTDSRVVLAVVILLGMIGVVGLGGVIWLVHDGADGNAVAIVASLSGPAIGALAAVLATTRTIDEGDVRDAGYNDALDDVRTLAEPSDT